MNLFYANGTPIINSLKVTSEVPLDPRLTVENIAERDSLVTNHISYDRMKVYVKSNDTKYIYHKDTGEWEIDNKFSEEDKSKLDRIDNYLIDTEYIYNPENKLLYREHSYDPNTDITTLRDHILQEARVSENGELYNGLLSKFYVNRLNNITNYLIDVSFTKGTDVPNLYLTTHSYNPDEDKTTLTNIDIPLATDDNHGLLSNLQNIKVNRIVDYVNRIDTTHTNAPDTGLTYNYNIYNPFTNANVTKTILIPLVTHTENGLTSSSDKIKIDDIETYVKSIALRQASGTEELGIDYIITNPNDQTDTPGYFNIPLVTDSRNGLVSPARKHWMDNASGVSNTGTASDTWQLDKKDINTRLDPNGGVIIKDSGGIAEIRNNTDSAYSDLTLNNITIKGDVTQEGRSFITEAETVEVRDNTLLLNRGETGAGVSKEFAGIEIDRGSEPKYQILFDESDDRFKVGVEGDLWNLALRESDDNMLDGYFISWNSKDKILSTTNIVNESTPLLFGRTDYKRYSGNKIYQENVYSSYSFIDETPNGFLYNSAGENDWNIDTSKRNFRFWKPLLGTTFRRRSDNSEVLYHADIVNNLTSGGTNKVLSAEQGKLLQNSITNIQGSYLPLSGGTMTGSIRFPVGLGIVCEDVSGSAAYGVLRTWNYNGSTRMYVGTVNFPTYISSTASDLIHDRNGSSYLLWDSYNLLDPAKLSADQTFTGLNTFTKKITVGSLTPSQILLDPSNEVVYRYASTEVSRGYSISLGTSNNIRKFTYGGYYSASKNDEYAYLSLPTQSWDSSSYKFYADKLAVPKVWSLTDRTVDAITLTNSSTTFGRESTPLRLRGDNTDLIYYRGNNTYKIWDKFNLSDPATLSGDNTFTGNNTFQVDKFNVGPFKVTSSGSLLININLQEGSAWSRSLTFRANSDNTSKSIFGGYNSIDNTSIGYAYIGIGDVNHSTAQYKFRPTSLTVPIAWSLDDPNGNALVWSQNSTLAHLGRASGTTKIRSGNTDLIHTKGSTEYIIWDKSNLPNPATSTDLNNYLPLSGGTLTGQVTIKQNVDIKLRLQSTDADNYCIIQAINAQASQLGVLGYARDKWAIGHGGTYYEIWDKYNLTDPVTYIADENNYATLKNKDGNNFTYIKTGVNGILPSTAVNLTSGGYGGLGSNNWSFDTGYINHLHTNKISFGTNGAFIDNQSGDSSRIGIGFYTSQSAGCPVYVGSLCVSDGYANSAPNIPANGIYSKGIIYIENGIGFRNSIWTNDLTPNRNYSGYLQVLDAYDAANAGGPNNYGTVLQINSRNSHWANQLWFSGGTEISKKGLYYRHMAYNQTEYGDWIKLATTSDLGNYLPLSGGTISSSKSNPLTINSTHASQSSIDFSRGGVNKGTVGFYESLGSFLQNVTGETLAVKSDGAYYGANTNSLRKLATVTDLAGYLPLSGGTMSGNISFNGDTGHIVVGARETSNFVSAVSFNKGSATNSAYIGYHSTGGSDSSGALILVPYPTSANPWDKAVGLYIAKNELLLDGKAIATQEYVNNRSVSWSNITGKPSTYTPSAHSHNSLQIEDNRDVTMLPNNMGSTTLRTFFNANKMPTSDWYSGIHISGWATNYAAWQLCGPSSNNTTTASSLYFRSGKDSTWNSWKKIAFTSDIPTNTSHLTNDSGFITSSALNGYATQSWANSQFAPLKNYFVTSNYASIATTGNEMCIGSLTSGNSIINVNYRNGTGTTSPSTWYWRAGSSTTWANAYWGNLYMNNNLVATQTWSNSQYPLKTGAGASGTWDINISGNASTASTASKLGSTTIGGSAKPIYLSSGTPTACSATVGSATVPVYMNAGTITQCSTTLGVSITGNAATATKWNGYSIWTGTEDELPSSRDANTLYFVKKSQ